MGHYDHAMKLLVDANPEAIVQFVLGQWRLTQEDAVQKHVKVIAQLSTEFQGTEADADGLLLIEAAGGEEYLIHIEFQSKKDPFMPDRLLDYCLRARRKHGPLPIVSCVIYLRDGQVQEPPEHWDWLNGHPYMLFEYVCIKLWEIPREEVLALKQPALLPLALLTKGEVNRIIVKDMFEELLANKRYDLLPAGQTIAAWILRGTNLEWLKKEYRKMLDIFKDSPAYEWMTEDAREEGLAQGLAQGREEGLHWAILSMIASRFPTVKRLAQNQLASVKYVAPLEKLVVNVSTAQTALEVNQYLLEALEESLELEGEVNT